MSRGYLILNAQACVVKHYLVLAFFLISPKQRPAPAERVVMLSAETRAESGVLDIVKACDMGLSGAVSLVSDRRLSGVVISLSSSCKQYFCDIVMSRCSVPTDLSTDGGHVGHSLRPGAVRQILVTEVTHGADHRLT